MATIVGDNTLAIYIVWDNGASAERGGPGESTNLGGAMNGIVPTTADVAVDG